MHSPNPQHTYQMISFLSVFLSPGIIMIYHINNNKPIWYDRAVVYSVGSPWDTVPMLFMVWLQSYSVLTPVLPQLYSFTLVFRVSTSLPLPFPLSPSHPSQVFRPPHNSLLFWYCGLRCRYSEVIVFDPLPTFSTLFLPKVILSSYHCHSDWTFSK